MARTCVLRPTTGGAQATYKWQFIRHGTPPNSDSIFPGDIHSIATTLSRVSEFDGTQVRTIRLLTTERFEVVHEETLGESFGLVLQHVDYCVYAVRQRLLETADLPSLKGCTRHIFGDV
ncbi:MAG: hypothetical protein ACKO3T_12285 [Planctomycetaceae bacterium]|jgi:hypothetical protein